jgi:hypothetical protein
MHHSDALCLSHRAHVLIITGASYRAKDRPALTEKGAAMA